MLINELKTGLKTTKEEIVGIMSILRGNIIGIYLIIVKYCFYIYKF